MKNRKLRKFLMLVSSALLLVCVTVGATVAYLTDTTNEVKNTFTIGNVSFDKGELENGLDEAKVDVYGNFVDSNGSTTDAEGNTYTTSQARVTKNTYKLIPGHTYTKDPTVHIGNDSENGWLFVKVENGIAAIEAKATNSTTSISAQMSKNDWSLVDITNNIYAYNEQVKADADVVVFESFTLDGSVSDETLKAYEDAEIVIQAYLVQADGFDTAANAWQGAPLNAWLSSSTEDDSENE